MSTLSFPLGTQTTTDRVTNVLIFISDSLRADTLPRRVAERGVTGAARAASSWTASSLPSLLTGQYPSTHGVWMFSDRLRERPPLLTADHTGCDIGIDCETHWVGFESSQKPTIQLL
jgi:arylsulfatase A-like enzyme